MARNSGFTRLFCTRNINFTRLLCFVFTHALMEGRDFLDPTAAVSVFHVQDRFRLPVKVISDKGYLFVQRLEGVAYDPPGPSSSMSKAWLHSGQKARTLARPLRLMRL